MRFLLIILLSLIWNNVLQALHGMGGEMSYVCLGNGDYEFRLKLYQSCHEGLINPLEQIAITIYDEQTEIATLQSVALGGNGFVAPQPVPCLILPSNLCMQEVSYYFRLSNLGVNLPAIDRSYYVTHQRCCRDNVAANVLDPSITGMSYTIELTPAAQAVCNNTPEFDDLLPIGICAGIPFEFNHAATDVDGDQLVYSFCSVLKGGGLEGHPAGDGDPTGCDGFRPNPACEPPYEAVNYVTPFYSAANPMGVNSDLSIDPETGVITTLPNIQGNYIVGICVEEYRNGELLSTMRRECQINVTSCNPSVNAQVRADSYLENGDAIINSCGNTTVYFVNESVEEVFIETYEWSFYLDDTLIINTRNAVVDFQEEGYYQARLILNKGLQCSDTIDMEINIYPEIIADFSYEYDTCAAGPIIFNDLSFSGSDTITDWFWSFGGNIIDTVQNPSYDHGIAGLLSINLIVTDINNCVDREIKVVEYFPSPPTLNIRPSSFQGCAPLSIFFENLSSPINASYDILWDFGDGNTSTEISPNHVYESSGDYTVSLGIISPIGCYLDTVFNDFITVKNSPQANFKFSPDNANSFEPEVAFEDQSIDAIQWIWNFDNDGFSTEQDPIFSFPDTGLQKVSLIVTHPNACMDTTYEMVDVEPIAQYFLPNAFTPNNDAVNDVFIGKGITDGVRNFNLSIWNRVGELVFETNDPTVGWNGRKNNTGKPAPNGVYICIVTYNSPRGQPVKIKGLATLIR